MFHLYPFANNNKKEIQQDSHLIEVKTGHRWLIQRKNIIYGNTHFLTTDSKLVMSQPMLCFLRQDCGCALPFQRNRFPGYIHIQRYS